MFDGKKTFANLKKYKLFVIMGIIGVVLMLIPINNESNTVKAASYSSEQLDGVQFSVSEYEESIEKILASVKGVGSVKVMLYLQSGTETVYVSDGSYGTNVSKQLYPAFGGAVIVCDGGASASVALKVTNAVASLTGLSSDKITVLQMK